MDPNAYLRFSKAKKYSEIVFETLIDANNLIPEFPCLYMHFEFRIGVKNLYSKGRI
jgi:hypothetical protein